MTNEAIEAAARALAISWFGSGVDEWAVAEVRPDAEAMLRAAAPALMEEGARLALAAAAEEAIAQAHEECEVAEIIERNIRALDPAAIVKGAGHE